MTRGSPVIDRERDLAGVTPEKLVRALLRNRHIPVTHTDPQRRVLPGGGRPDSLKSLESRGGFEPPYRALRGTHLTARSPARQRAARGLIGTVRKGTFVPYRAASHSFARSAPWGVTPPLGATPHTRFRGSGSQRTQPVVAGIAQ